MVDQLVVVAGVHVLGHMQAEVDEEQELHLQRVDLLARDSANFGVVCVVVVGVIKELCSQHDTAKTSENHISP
jgi:hypothetical protein